MQPKNVKNSSSKNWNIYDKEFAALINPQAQTDFVEFACAPKNFIPIFLINAHFLEKLVSIVHLYDISYPLISVYFRWLQRFFEFE